MTRIDDLVAAIAALDRADLELWVGEALVTPRREGETLVFSEMDCARVRLLCTLRYDLEIDHDAMAVVVSLMDQLYDARRKLMALSAAVARQDAPVRDAILAALPPVEDAP
ncbi:MAG: hypothetical protein CVT71_02955 [Alphaproteobacteria bacterium HGW-Alphaproteobacteria-10]|nr:MAG: hypothetical protein CVT71_02955 [Alphaproteobacteria bacterium HGW-Alphaproteobacteria-10]